MTVDRIAAKAFSGNTTITSVTIPGSIVCIENNAFLGCSGLTSVVINDGVVEIQANAFHSCSSIIIVVIPDSVTKIGGNAFAGCTKATLLCGARSQSSERARTWNSSNRPVVWKYAGSTGTSNGLNWALVNDNTVVICGYTGSSASITLPTTISGKEVSGISENAFRGNTTITSIFIPTCIDYIGSYAFYGCTGITINCEVASAPSGWSSSWKDSNATVYWSM